MGSIRGKNRRSKISCYCPFKYIEEFREITRKIWENAADSVNIMGIFSGDCNIRFAAFLKTDPVQSRYSRTSSRLCSGQNCYQPGCVKK